MILVGQYDSPYVRRVAISLRTLGIPYEHDTRSVFGDFDSMRQTNPLARIPSLVLDDGAVLIDSAAILDWLDEQAGSRSLLPRGGLARQQALQMIALATGLIDKVGAANYERLIRPAQVRWPEWIERCLTQARGALDALEATEWPKLVPLDQARITTGCALGYIKLTDPGLMPTDRYPSLNRLSGELETRPEFLATSVTDYAVPRG